MSTTRNKLAMATSFANMTREQHVAEARRVSSWHRHAHIARIAISWTTQFEKETIASLHRAVNPDEPLSTWVEWVRTFGDRRDLPASITKRAGSQSSIRQAGRQYRKEIKRAIERGVTSPRSAAAVRVVAAMNRGELAGFKRLTDVSGRVRWLGSSPRILNKWPLANLERLRNRLESAIACVEKAIEKAESKARRA